MEQTAVEYLLEKYKSQNTLLFAEDFEQAKEMENNTKLRNQLFKGKVAEIIGENKTIQLIIECNIELQ